LKHGTQAAYIRARLEPELTLLKEVQQLQKHGGQLPRPELPEEVNQLQRHGGRKGSRNTRSLGASDTSAYIRARLERDSPG
jgi:hypothetical protein